MNETKQILNAYELAQSKHEASVLATVTYVEGSSYRRPGARMLITESGEMIGCVSGGCLERDLLNKAAFILSKNEAQVLTYDTREDTDDARDAVGAGLGCNGFIEILVEPISANEKHPVLEKMKQWMTNDEVAGLILFPHQKNAEPIFWEADAFEVNAPQLKVEALRAFEKQKTYGKTLLIENRETKVFFETFCPPVQMTIFGAGYDAVSMASLAVKLGHDVRVVDLRSSVPVPRGAFRGVSSYIQCETNEISEKVKFNSRSVVILMTHQANDDLAALPSILKAKPAYLGLLGPKIRGQKLLDEAKKNGFTILDSELENVFFPVGLDIGAESPNEIALSVLAEVNAVSRGRAGGSLRNRIDPIHLRGVS